MKILTTQKGSGPDSLP